MSLAAEVHTAQTGLGLSEKETLSVDWRAVSAGDRWRGSARSGVGDSSLLVAAAGERSLHQQYLIPGSADRVQQLVHRGDFLDLLLGKPA